MTLPTLAVVSGPPGSGKTTPAHEIARILGCPAVCRDEIKQGMAHATPGFEPTPDDPLNQRTLAAFFDVLGVLLRAGVTVVAEAAFQDKLWRPNLEPLTDLA
jgi:predicted kinase